MIKGKIPAPSNYASSFWYLFCGLLLTLLASPFSADLPVIGRYSMTLMFNVFMLISVWSLAASVRIFRFGAWLIVGISSAIGIHALVGDSLILELFTLLLMLTFCVISCYIAAKNVFNMNKVNLDSLIGAFCVYLLQGVIWALLYRLLLLFDWSSFTGNITADEQAIFSDLLYFSFVTLASLGYGDIAPVGGLTKTFAYLEAITGQFYLAVMVASLVGVFISGRIRH
jgi:voltage-gated potassium channel